MNKIKAVFCDIDGTLTDGTVYYSEKGEEFKQFSHRDGRAFHLLRESTKGKTNVYLITSEEGGINQARAEKFERLRTITTYFMGKTKKEDVIKEVCQAINIDPSEALFIGDDTNDLEAMKLCGYRACPADAFSEIKDLAIPFTIANNNGGHGAVRDIIEYYLSGNMFYGQGEE